VIKFFSGIGFIYFISPYVNEKIEPSKKEGYHQFKTYYILTDSLIKKWEEFGLIEGRIYKAWYLILSNPAIFEPLFKKLENKDKPENKGTQDNKPKSDKNKKVINALTTSLFKEKTFIPKELKNHFIKILNGEQPQKEKWDDTDWYLYIIFESFIKANLYNIKVKEITNILLQNFIFNKKKINKNI